eukprot:EG_transcript_12888
MADALFRAFSQGTGHRVSEAQFITCMQLLLRGTPEERATFMFRVFDRDGDGRLEKRELWDVVAFCRDSVELPDDKLEEAWATMGGGQVGSVRREDFERFIIPMLHQEAESAEKLSRTDALPLTFGSPSWRVVMPVLRTVQLLYLKGFESAAADHTETFTDCVIKAHQPASFHSLRSIFGYNPEQYLQDLGVNKLLESLLFGKLTTPREISTSSKSGSFFFMSVDRRLIVKTVRWFEAQKLLQALPRYLAHFQRAPRSLLTQFCGVFENPKDHLWFVIMKNLIPPDCTVRALYDLKGSSHKRSTPPEERKGPMHALKDNDLTEVLQLCSESEYQRLMKQIQMDVEMLTESKCIDYSLLVCIATPNEDADMDRLLAQSSCFRSPSNVLYFIGIIDVLLEYNKLTKPGTLLSHLHENASWKPPREYADRFVKFMRSKFS